MKTKWFSVLLVLSMLIISFAPAGGAYAGAGGGGGNSADSTNDGPRVDTEYALVQLRGDPLATYVKTKPPEGKKIDFDSNTVKSYRAQLSALRNEFKSWLRQNARNARVTGEFDLALNAVSVKLNGTSLSTLASAPMVLRAEYQGLYYPTVDDPDLAIISAVQAWNQAGGAATAGEGIKVAIVDTGIDASHPCFDDSGYPAQTQLGDTTFTNNKVIVAKVFNMKTPGRGYTPEAINAHGTHVAGTVACNYLTPATVEGVDIPYDMSGVAPRALLGNYNVFPADVTNAHSEDIIDALEAAYADGFDVANMSLGGGSSGINDLLAMAVDNLDLANMVVAVAAGNSGPGHYTIESPGKAARALTAGASTVGHFLGAEVTDDTDPASFAAAVGDFGPTADATGPLSANLGTYCTAGAAGTLAGQIALINRGTCTFSIKIRNAQTAGAVGAIIVNNVFGPPISMGSDGTANQPTIPGVMVSKSDQTSLNGRTGNTFTIHSELAYVFDAVGNDFMAGFSSQGPTDVDFRVKPDVVAPGVNVLSSIPMSQCDSAVDPNGCFAFFQGTSMATPHLAGSAAVVKGQYPTWTAAQIRSAIVNTADQDVLKNSDGTIATDVNVIGSGRENLWSAVNAVVALDPVSISFGAVPSGSGLTQTFVLTLTNLSGGAATFDVAVDAGGGGVGFSVSPSDLTLAAGASGTVTVTMSAVHGAAGGDHQAKLAVSMSGTEVAHAAVYVFIK
ncbi:MAG TPA: S8 family serine peptidase [Anaerolineales bacterium]|nr:S8 family serine peptidase [Anaerolineales bacterium]